MRHDERDRLQAELADQGITTLIHYPIPPHRQQAYDDLTFGALPVAQRMADQMLSLPLGPHLRPEQQQQVIDVMHDSFVAGA